MDILKRLKQDNLENSDTWKIDPYSNPLSHSTMIFAFHCENRFFPIGTIFFIGKTGFMLSASHVFDEGLLKSKHNKVMRESIANGEFQKNVKGDLGFSALRFNSSDGFVTSITLIGIENIAACIPGDIFYASPLIGEALLPIDHLTLKPAMPEVGEKVFSCGYTNFDYDIEAGLPLDKIRSGHFNWRDSISFDFMVYEGEIMTLYTSKFAESYLNAPCFSVNYCIPHGLSGGPTFTKNGIVCGVNSASFGGESLISLLYPSIFTNIKSTLRIGPLTINNNSSICQHMGFGSIATDGSEESIKYAIKNDSLCVYHKWADFLNSNTFADRNGYELGIPAKPKQ
jgi:hypothetical protein